MKRLITDDVVAREFAAGKRRIPASSSDAVITPAAWSKARELGVVIGEGKEPPARSVDEKPRREDKGDAERSVDASGVVVVRGRSVRMGRFTGAGTDKDIGLTDLITGADRSPMTAGMMSFSAADSFEWSLEYDEIDLVLEGVLHIQIDGRVVEGRAGDVLFVPKGSKIVFATPNRTKVFYVTYPANWAG